MKRSAGLQRSFVAGQRRSAFGLVEGGAELAAAVGEAGGRGRAAQHGQQGKQSNASDHPHSVSAAP